jgi:hypothetical protein
MGVFQKDDLALDFHGRRTEDFSSTIPYMNKLNTNAKMLVSQLDINSNYNKKGLVLFNESDHYDMYKLFEKSTNINNNDNNFSETSPFISSDVYNQLLKKIKHKQTGGADKKSKKSKKSKSSNKSSSSASESDKKSKRSKRSVSSTKSLSESPRIEDRDNDHDHDFEDDESSTSSDSDSDNSDRKTQNKKIKHIFKEKSEEIDLEPEEEQEEFSEMSAGSYLSSSAHTDNNSSDNNSSAKSRVSTVSAKNHHRRNYSESINTSDINIISVDD